MKNMDYKQKNRFDTRIAKNIILYPKYLIKRVLFEITVKCLKPKKIVVGAGSTNYRGWLSSEANILDIRISKDWEKYVKPNSLTNILAEHVVEHIEHEEFVLFLRVVKPFLKMNGVIRIAVPDGNHPSQYVRDLVGINVQEPGADEHKYFYKVGDMEDIADNLGYKLEKLEYFRDDGVFQHNKYNENHGFISRSAENYTGRFTNDSTEYEKFISSTPIALQDQFIKNNFSYTSLIVDFIKVNESK